MVSLDPSLIYDSPEIPLVLALFALVFALTFLQSNMGFLDIFSSSSSKRDRLSPPPPAKQSVRLTKEKPGKFNGSNVQHTLNAVHSTQPRASSRSRILFYDKHKAFYEFTNFSPHPVEYNGKTYPTSEHLFQSFKFIDEYPDIAELIRTGGNRPMAAFDEAHRYQNWVRPDWRQVNVAKMEEVLYLKFTQNKELRKLLLDTGDAELVEDSPWDYFWGVGANHSGRNELGKALERLRDDLRHGTQPNYLSRARHDQHRQSLQPFPATMGPNSPQQASSQPRRQLAASMPTQQLAPLMATGKDSNLCEFCHQRSKNQGHPFCGRTCASQAMQAQSQRAQAPTNAVCALCQVRPRSGNHPFCSKTCAAEASKKTFT